MTIFRSVGPVISTRRSSNSSGIGATVQAVFRICSVSGRNAGNSPRSNASLAVAPCLEQSQPGGPEARIERTEKFNCFRGQYLRSGFIERSGNVRDGNGSGH